MKRGKAEAIAFCTNAIIVGLNAAVFAALWLFVYADQIDTPFFAQGNYLMVALFVILYVSFSHLYGGFSIKISRIAEITYSQGTALFITYFLLYLITWILCRSLPPVLPALLALAGSVILTLLWAFCANRLRPVMMEPQQILLVYGHDKARQNAREIIEDLPWQFRFAGEVCSEQGSEAVYKAVEEQHVRCIMLCGVASSQRNDIVKYCVANDIEVYLRPNIGDLIVNGSKTTYLANLPVVVCKRARGRFIYPFLKRFVDILFSSLGLLLASPFMLVTAIAIKAYDGGPVLYSQTRLTKGDKPFKIYKFRSMRVNAESDGVARLASQNDDRITPVGKIIRATRLDELPQIFCILRGDMSIVGPRPERPEIAAEYEQEIPEFALRLQVPAGLTGYAQVYGKYNTSPYDKLQMDLLYIAERSLITDIKVIFATIKVIFLPESTEGVAKGQTTAAEKIVARETNNESRTAKVKTYTFERRL